MSRQKCAPLHLTIPLIFGCFEVPTRERHKRHLGMNFVHPRVMLSNGLDFEDLLPESKARRRQTQTNHRARYSPRLFIIRRMEYIWVRRREDTAMAGSYQSARIYVSPAPLCGQRREADWHIHGYHDRVW